MGTHAMNKLPSPSYTVVSRRVLLGIIDPSVIQAPRIAQKSYRVFVVHRGTCLPPKLVVVLH